MKIDTTNNDFRIFDDAGNLRGRFRSAGELAEHLALAIDEIDSLNRERDEARRAARWMLPFVALDGAGYGRVHESCQRWPWLEDMEAPE